MLAISAIVFSPFAASNATFALNAESCILILLIVILLKQRLIYLHLYLCPVFLYHYTVFINDKSEGVSGNVSALSEIFDPLDDDGEENEVD